MVKRSLENPLALVSGIIIGTLGTIVHNLSIGWFPYGLIIALAGSYGASKLVGVQAGRRGVRFWFFIGWLLITLRGAIFGNSDELLIMANNAGNAYLGLGFLLVLASIWARI
jgi:hypothetical protein